MRRYRNIEWKSFEIWTDDLEGPGKFSITERVKGCPCVISFVVVQCVNVIQFLKNAKEAS